MRFGSVLSSFQVLFIVAFLGGFLSACEQSGDNSSGIKGPTGLADAGSKASDEDSDDGGAFFDDGGPISDDDAGPKYMPVDGGPACGNALVDGDEACDDGNAAPGDGCSGMCQVEPYFNCPTEGGVCVSTIVCGNGLREPGENCDDGNTNSSDGCDSTCQREPFYYCPEPGTLCTSLVTCGDGIVSGIETCDDSNTNTGDGCNATCQVEAGYACTAPGRLCQAAECGDGVIAGVEECEDDDDPPADGDGCDAACLLEDGYACDIPGESCHATECNDGIQEGSEQCDDNNNDMGDGCTPFCMREPDCSQGACTTACGDGILLPSGTEECDDSNIKAGDGCSPTCTIEPGFVCQNIVEAPDELNLPIVLRDFTPSRNPDFQHDPTGTDKDIVAVDLGVDGKPVYTGQAGNPTTTGQTNFDRWYRDTPDVNITILQTLVLSKVANGFQYSNGEFFPIDGLGYGNYSYNDYIHNFHFTSEVRYWFEYQGGEKLDFTGDDDVWVFVNRRLAVDLGGIHGAQNGSVSLDSAAATTYNLTPGEIYEIVVFQAERRTSQSNYKLTLGDFNNAKSACETVCGDGVVTPDEACDDGETENTGGYNKCKVDCTLDTYCGDGVLQGDHEECDDGQGANVGVYGDVGGCSPICTLVPYCQDGIVQDEFGEACDKPGDIGNYGVDKCTANCLSPPYCGDGVTQTGLEQCDIGTSNNNGEYGGCTAVCKFGPYCGDGVVNGNEECDDGNNTNQDGCSEGCKTESVVR